MTSRALLLLMLALAAGTATAQVYKWTDEKGRVHYGEKPPPDKPAARIVTPPSGAAAQAIEGGKTIDIPADQLPKLPPEEAERRRRIIERMDKERDDKERAAMRDSPEGRHFCAQVEEHIRQAQQGPLKRYDRPDAYATEAERKAFLQEWIGVREKNCR